MPNNGHNTTIGGGGFHHLALRANDYDATLKFYCEGLGFRRAYGWGEDGRAKGEKDSRVALLDTGDGNYLEVFAGGTETLPEGVFMHYALRTTDCDSAIERAKQAGATVTMEPKNFTPAHPDEPVHTFRIGFVRGLNGELIEFFQHETL